MFAAPTGPLGASVETRDGVPQWVAYIGTLDVDATVETAKRLGAKVAKEPETLPNAGRYAVLTDPNGATFGVHGSPGEPRPETDPQEGEFCWHELATTVDPVDAFAFYKELFGWDDLGQHDMGSIGIYLLFGRNGKQLGGMFKKGDLGKPGPAYWVGYVRTKNVDKMADEVKAARGQVLNGPMAVPGGHRIAQFTDPHGAFFAGHTLAEDVQAAPAKKAAAPKPPKPAVASQAAKPAAAPQPAKPAAAPQPAKPAAAAAPKPVPAKVAKVVEPAKVKPKKAAKAAPKKAPKKGAAKKGSKVGKKKTAKKKSAKKVAKKVAKKSGKKKSAKKAQRAGAKKSAKAAKNKKKTNKKKTKRRR
jgi:predicted enzyme related to lactoylglutathione lyase